MAPSTHAAEAAADSAPPRTANRRPRLASLVVAAAVFAQVAVRATDGILLRNVHIPSFAVYGREAVLECDYDLEGRALYSVKWYKNGLEIYRYVPGNLQRITDYSRPGVTVDVDHSDDRQVRLKELTMKSTGRYRCEVSTEGPSFATVSNYGDMIIVVLPSSGPLILGGLPRYEVGDLVNVTCISRGSKPAADLSWFINGQQPGPSELHPQPIVNSSDLHTSTLGLTFNVTKDHFRHGEGNLKLKCTATIASIYWQSNEKSAEGFKQKRASRQFSGGGGRGHEDGGFVSGSFDLSDKFGFNSGDRSSFDSTFSSAILAALSFRASYYIVQI